MFNVSMEWLMIKFMVLAMTSVDDRIVIGLAVVDFSGRLMNELFRVDAPAVHRWTLIRSIVGSSGNDGSLNGTIVVTRGIVVSKGMLLAV